MVVRRGQHRIVGFVDLGELHEDIEKLGGKMKAS